MHLKQNSAPAVSISALQWAQILARYRKPSHSRSILEIALTLLPFAGLWTLAWAASRFGYWELSPPFSILAAGFLVRLFMVQHDCGHGAFFRRRRMNDWVGRVIGVFTLTPYDAWRRSHSIHHAGAGHLKRRGIGDIGTLTVREFQALSYWRRLRYRLYRHPLIMFGIGPGYLFVLRNRLPVGFIHGGRRAWTSTFATNLTSAVVVATLIWFVGIGPFLLIQLPITLIAALIGVWLFYIQHQFEKTFWAHGDKWGLHEAALYGSSHYDLPRVLRWFTANIGVHHAHHLCSGIPYYHLPRVLSEHPELGEVNRLTLLQSFGCVRLVLWDETQRRLVSFRDARAIG